MTALPTASAAAAANAASARPVKRSFSIAGHRTSISLEAAFWDALKAVASREQISLASLVMRIDETRGPAGLSSAVRVWLLDDLRRQVQSSCHSG